MARRNGNGTNWAVIISGAALGLTLLVNVLGFANRDTERIDKRLSQVESDLAWKFVTKELLLKDTNYIGAAITDLKNTKTEKDVYEQKSASIERQIVSLRQSLQALDQSVNQTFNARDAFNTVQQRILELERQTRAPLSR